MERPLLVIPVAVLAAVTGVAGCSSDEAESRPSAKPASSGPAQSGPAPSSPAAPTQAMITWVGEVCDADDDLQAQQGASRTAALSMVPRQPTREQIVTFVTATQEGLEDNLKKFQKVNKGTFDGGDQVVAAYVTAVKGALALVEKAEKTAKDGSSPELLLSYLPQQVANYVAAAVPKGADLPGLLARDPALNQAYKQAKSCKNADPLTATPAPTPTA